MFSIFHQKILSFLTIFIVIYLCSNFASSQNFAGEILDDRQRTRLSAFRYSESEIPRQSRFVNIFTNHPNLKDVEDSYYQRYSPQKSSQIRQPSDIIDRKDTLHFNNIEDIFASPAQYNLDSEYGQFDQNYGASSIVKYYEKPPDFVYKKPSSGNNFDKDDSYIYVPNQIVSPEKGKYSDPNIDIKNKRFPYYSNINYDRRKNISDFYDFGDTHEPEMTTRYSYVQKITRSPENSRYAEFSKTTEKSDKYEEIPIMTVAQNQKYNQNFSSLTRNKIADVLRHYLIKLYNKKYLNTGENHKHNSLDKNEDNKYFIYDNSDDNVLENPRNSVLKPKIPKIDDSESKLLTGDTLWYLKNKTLSKMKKFFSIFTVVKFNNTECNATTLYGTWQGLCYTPAECIHMGGISFDACAGGYGICCVFRGTCGDWSSRNCTYFKSPNYPDYYPPGGEVIVPTTTSSTPTGGTPDPRLHWFYHSQILEDSKNTPSDHLDFDSKYSTYEIVSKSLENARNGLDDPVDDALMSRQNTDTISCIYSVYKNNPNIKQMRIDFVDLELVAPTNGTCQTERLVITGQNNNNPIPVICGYNTGQHIYVDVSQLNGPLQLMVLSTTGAKKRFKIRICQYDDTCQMPNSNCLQYYTGVMGVLQSFNYDQASMLNRSRPGYFNNLNYAICIRREAGYCSITYSNVQNGVTYPFQLVNLNNAGQSTIPLGQAGVDVLNCPDDYIVIDGTRLCGERFNDGSTNTGFNMNAAVTDTSAGPIIVSVRTDSDTTGLGFKLFYTQNRCSSTPINSNTPDPRS